MTDVSEGETQPPAALRAEIVTVGTELLLGQIVDSNSSWIAEQLASIGVGVHFATKVGDNHGRMVEAFRLALSRADAVVITGGLGPTQDDITREAIAEVTGRPLSPDADVTAVLERIFGGRGREMARSNLRQADVPEGATVIPMVMGTAPGLIVPAGEGKVIYAVPGVPAEMKEMVPTRRLARSRRADGRDRGHQVTDAQVLGSVGVAPRRDARAGVRLARGFGYDHARVPRRRGGRAGAAHGARGGRSRGGGVARRRGGAVP